MYKRYPLKHFGAFIVFIDRAMIEFRKQRLINRGNTRHTFNVSSVMFSPDGKSIVFGSWDHTICLWNAATGEALSNPFKGHTSYVSSVMFSPDSKHIVSGSWDHTVCVWNSETGKFKPFEGHNLHVYSVAFSSGMWRQERL
jgi:WD40 repeat protein